MHTYHQHILIHVVVILGHVVVIDKCRVRHPLSLYAVQTTQQQENERLHQQLSDKQRAAAAAASAAEATIRDLQQQLTTAQHNAAQLQATQQQALHAEQQRLQQEQQAHSEAMQQLSEAQQQLAAVRARLLDAETSASAATARAVRAENQAAALAGAETQVMMRMLQEQVQQQQQQLTTLQEAAAAAAQVPGLQQALTAAREEARGARARLSELDQSKQQLEQAQQELSLFRAAFKVGAVCVLVLCVQERVVTNKQLHLTSLAAAAATTHFCYPPLLKHTQTHPHNTQTTPTEHAGHQPPQC